MTRRLLTVAAAAAVFAVLSPGWAGEKKTYWDYLSSLGMRPMSDEALDGITGRLDGGSLDNEELEMGREIYRLLVSEEFSLAGGEEPLQKDNDDNNMRRVLLDTDTEYLEIFSLDGKPVTHLNDGKVVDYMSSLRETDPGMTCQEMQRHSLSAGLLAWKSLITDKRVIGFKYNARGYTYTHQNRVRYYEVGNLCMTASGKVTINE
ncbi:MAG: hypothetical protein JRI97_00725 [Deltaproteobacteria bacterium]|nr:hypothetical protein [Deltaproteobacteria bacterium]